MLLRGEPVVDGRAQNRRLLPPEGPRKYSRPEPGFLPRSPRYGGAQALEPLEEGSTNRSDFGRDGLMPSIISGNDEPDGPDP